MLNTDSKLLVAAYPKLDEQYVAEHKNAHVDEDRSCWCYKLAPSLILPPPSNPGLHPPQLENYPPLYQKHEILRAMRNKKKLRTGNVGTARYRRMIEWIRQEHLSIVEKYDKAMLAYRKSQIQKWRRMKNTANRSSVSKTHGTQQQWVWKAKPTEHWHAKELREQKEKIRAILVVLILVLLLLGSILYRM